MNIKELLTESMTSIAYHFCPIDSLWAIMESKKFKLTQSNVTSSEDREKCTVGGYTYPYYMCFSRSHSCLNGYVRRRNVGREEGFDWDRIGNALNGTTWVQPDELEESIKNYGTMDKWKAL